MGWSYDEGRTVPKDSLISKTSLARDSLQTHKRIREDFQCQLPRGSAASELIPKDIEADRAFSRQGLPWGNVSFSILSHAGENTRTQKAKDCLLVDTRKKDTIQIHPTKSILFPGNTQEWKGREGASEASVLPTGHHTHLHVRCDPSGAHRPRVWASFPSMGVGQVCTPQHMRTPLGREGRNKTKGFKRAPV